MIEKSMSGELELELEEGQVSKVGQGHNRGRPQVMPG